MAACLSASAAAVSCRLGRLASGTGWTKVPSSKSAELGGLRLYDDSHPGYSRRAKGKGFTYFNAEGKPIDNPVILKRIQSLAIPPAWKNVWISPLANGHLQAVGVDDAGRKQYRYHEKWEEVRSSAKFDRATAFGQALPRLRARVTRDLNLPGLPKEKVLAAAVRMLEKTLIRVGDKEYADEHGTYGLTTLQDEHADISGTRVDLSFRGKSGVDHDINVDDAKLASVLEASQRLPGLNLFQYVDEAGKPHPLTAEDVNQYIGEALNGDFTAKDFRTWGGTMLAARILGAEPRPQSEKEANTVEAEAIKQVAEKLGNTPAVSRKSYIDPAVLQAYRDGSLQDWLSDHSEAKSR